MNDQLLGQQGIGSKDALKVPSSAFSPALESPYDDERESLKKPEVKPTSLDESLDFEDLESTMWRKVRIMIIRVVHAYLTCSD